MKSPEELVKKDPTLFTLPDIYLEVKRVIDNPDSTMADLSRIISADPGMTALVLKLVNSAFYAMPKKVETISRAVGILGMQPIHDLVLAISITTTFSGISQQIMNMNIFWANSFFSGLAARELARTCLLIDSERMFVEGLLRDLGHLLMYEFLPEESEESIRRAEKTGEPLHKVEQEIFGFDFAQVGKALVEEWRLPKNLGEAILFQTQPANSQNFGFEAALLNIAGALTEGFQSPMGKCDWAILVAPESWNLTALAEEDVIVCMLEAGKQLSTMLDLLDEARAQVA